MSAEGEKLRPLIIFKGQPGGSVEDGCAHLPDRAVYAVQENAWMNSHTWTSNSIGNLWEEHVATQFPDPLAIYVDNLGCHVSTASTEAFAACGTEVVPLPKNTTSVLQPLDVGVIGSFKQKLRALALAADIEHMRSNPGVPLRERLLVLMNKPAHEKHKAIATRVIKAWDSISADSIKSAWQKAGL